MLAALETQKKKCFLENTAKKRKENHSFISNYQSIYFQPHFQGPF